MTGGWLPRWRPWGIASRAAALPRGSYIQCIPVHEVPDVDQAPCDLPDAIEVEFDNAAAVFTPADPAVREASIAAAKADYVAAARAGYGARVHALTEPLPANYPAVNARRFTAAAARDGVTDEPVDVIRERDEEARINASLRAENRALRARIAEQDATIRVLADAAIDQAGPEAGRPTLPATT